MMSRPPITELPACGPSRGGNHPKTLRGPVGKERPAGRRSHVWDGGAMLDGTEPSPDLQIFLSRPDD